MVIPYRKANTFNMLKPGPMTRQSAEALAIEALSFLAADAGRIGRFLALSGIGPDQLRAASREPGFLAGILDHIAADEQLMMLFADHAERHPQDVRRAQAVLSGRQWERDIP